MSIFRFRHFQVRQEKAAMKIGTDSVLLGCFCIAEGAGRILDIGTGTGILALMMAQKCQARIDAVEIDENAFAEARTNFASSSWHERIHIHHGPIQGFEEDNYDIIISNPPYFRHKQQLAIGDARRSKARHDKDLSLETLYAISDSKLSESGRLWVILPVQEAGLFVNIASASLHLEHKIEIRPKPSKTANRMVLCFGKKQQPVRQDLFTIYEDDGSPSRAYVELTKDFYLWKQFDSDPALKQ